MTRLVGGTGDGMLRRAQGRTLAEQEQSALGQPHYVLDIITGVRCGEFPTRETAESWIVQYRVAESYKAEHYRVQAVADYWRGYVWRS